MREKDLNKERDIVFSNTLSLSEAFSKHNYALKTKDFQLRDAALLLRDIIVSSESNPLSENLTIDSLLQGKTKNPVKLKQFFQYSMFGRWSWFAEVKKWIKAISYSVYMSRYDICCIILLYFVNNTLKATHDLKNLDTE